MSPIDFLLNRQSNPNLTAPAPNKDELSTILQAAMSVPDHGAIMPFQITVVDEQAREKLSEIYVNSAVIRAEDEVKLAKVKKMPYRSPMMLIVSTQYQQHPKVPKQEQLITAGCAVHVMQMACVALGYNGMWRTGDMAYCDVVKQGLNINPEEDIVGFLYIGTESKSLPDKNRKSFEQVTQYLS
ncbi:nitroreductase [Thalassotalea sp. M1531]|uniref:Putative NAD(P)H nitroreductase n=1 Tax=Thalassotalea algicola TaxID=2716224 RepID=A0A7Y0Q7G4_9GAMM|nr:nitroreductase [Thalassotalea algicola]